MTRRHANGHGQTHEFVAEHVEDVVVAADDHQVSGG